MSQLIRVAGIVPESIVDGPGIRYTLFVQGCPHGCPGCHNPQTHPFEGGTLYTPQQLLEQVQEDPLISGVTLSGGEPLCQAQALLPFAQGLRQLRKNILCYSGYTFEALWQEADPQRLALLELCDLLIDGPFLQEEKSLELLFRGSRNQRILDVPASLAAGKAVLAAAYLGR